VTRRPATADRRVYFHRLFHGTWREVPIAPTSPIVAALQNLAPGEIWKDGHSSEYRYQTEPKK
jgi:hypothetical protein